MEQIFQQMCTNMRPLNQEDIAEINEFVSNRNMSDVWPTLLYTKFLREAKEANFELAESVFEYACEHYGDVNLSLLLARISLCAAQGREELMMDSYKKLWLLTDVLGRDAYVSLITALTQTSHWKEAFNILAMMKRDNSFVRDIDRIEPFSHLAAASFGNGEQDKGLALLESLNFNDRSNNVNLKPIVYTTLMDLSDRKLIFKYLKMMQRSSWIASYGEMMFFRIWFDS